MSTIKINNNGFSTIKDYQFVLNLVKSAIEDNGKIHTFAVNQEPNGNVVVILNDVKVTFEQFQELMTLAGKNNVEVSELPNIKKWVATTIIKHLNEVMKSEGWK